MSSSSAARDRPTRCSRTFANERGIIGGSPLSKYYRGHDNDFLVCCYRNKHTGSRSTSLVDGLESSYPPMLAAMAIL